MPFSRHPHHIYHGEEAAQRDLNFPRDHTEIIFYTVKRLVHTWLPTTQGGPYGSAVEQFFYDIKFEVMS